MEKSRRYTRGSARETSTSASSPAAQTGSAGERPTSYKLDHLRELEAEAIYLIRAVALIRNDPTVETPEQVRDHIHHRAVAEALGRHPYLSTYSPDMSKHFMYGNDPSLKERNSLFGGEA